MRNRISFPPLVSVHEVDTALSMRNEGAASKSADRQCSHMRRCQCYDSSLDFFLFVKNLRTFNKISSLLSIV
jgi:hypothetical protein